MSKKSPFASNITHVHTSPKAEQLPVLIFLDRQNWGWRRRLYRRPLHFPVGWECIGVQLQSNPVRCHHSWGGQEQREGQRDLWAGFATGKRNDKSIEVTKCIFLKQTEMAPFDGFEELWQTHWVNRLARNYSKHGVTVNCFSTQSKVSFCSKENSFHFGGLPSSVQVAIFCEKLGFVAKLCNLWVFQLGMLSSEYNIMNMLLPVVELL